jgi:hypothetical protein
MSNRFHLHNIDHEVNQLNFITRMFTLQMVGCGVLRSPILRRKLAFLHEITEVKLHTHMRAKLLLATYCGVHNRCQLSHFSLFIHRYIVNFSHAML